MPSHKFEIDPAVARLAQMRFSAQNIIAATGSTDDVLTNFLTKAKPILCSESPGRGRAREYCLIDAYQFALWTRLTQLTRKANWSARALESLLFEKVSDSDIENAEEVPTANSGWRLEATRPDDERREQVNHLRGQFCANIASAPPLYWSRPGYGVRPTFYIVVDPIDIEAGRYGIHLVLGDDGIGRSSFGRDGIFIHATALLKRVDDCLLNLTTERAAAE